jgi:hypothetical protein
MPRFTNQISYALDMYVLVTLSPNPVINIIARDGWKKCFLLFISDILGWSKVHEGMLKNCNQNMVLLVCKRIWIRT